MTSFFHFAYAESGSLRTVMKRSSSTSLVRVSSTLRPNPPRADGGRVQRFQNSATFCVELLVPAADHDFRCLRHEPAWTAAALALPECTEWMSPDRSVPMIVPPPCDIM